jgi:hypothetical protein
MPNPAVRQQLPSRFMDISSHCPSNTGDMAQASRQDFDPIASLIVVGDNTEDL